MNIAVIHGGTSSEQAVSTLNAGYVMNALGRRGYRTTDILFTRDVSRRLLEERPDAVFLCVQGKGHGDGTLQAILDHLEIPYTGSGMQAAAIINDKILCQKLFAIEGIRIPADCVWTEKEHCTGDGKKRFEERLGKSGISFPCVAKAPTQGGSFGIVLIESMDAYDLMQEAFFFDSRILIEQFVSGRFATVGILEQSGIAEALPVVEGRSRMPCSRIIKFTGEYDVYPSDLPSEIISELQNTALRTYRTLGARGYARVDFIVEEESGRPFILEINAVPGLKPQSLYPPAAALAGIGYDDLIEIILQNVFFDGENG